jgi:hypothetical protein
MKLIKAHKTNTVDNDVTNLKRIPKLLIFKTNGRGKQLTGSDDENAAQDKA